MADVPAAAGPLASTPVHVPASVVVEAALAADVIEDVKAQAVLAQPEVTATVQEEAPAAVVIVETVKAEIAAEPVRKIEAPVAVADVVEAVPAAEAPVADVRSEPVQIDLVDAVNEAASEPVAPVEVAVAAPAPQQAPKPASVPATGSLFFVADADTPPSVTRSLFEPVVTPVKPADDIAHDDKQDDETSEERSV